MEVPPKEQRILSITSGNRCAFPGCPEALVKFEGPFHRPVVTGQIAHIVSESNSGPRGCESMLNGTHNKYENLIFLCPAHHKIVDENPATYTAERLRQMKSDHEVAVCGAIQFSYPSHLVGRSDISNIRTQLHSTLLPVERMPRFIWSAKSNYGDKHEKDAARKVAQPMSGEMCPFLIRMNGTLFAFNDLSLKTGPFRDVVNPGSAEQQTLVEFAEDPDKHAWLITLLNRTLNKLTGRKGLKLDKDHHRYFFESRVQGEELQVQYRPLNLNSLVSRNVVWQPRVRKTGEKRPYWYHKAVSLKFIFADRDAVYLSVRPEMRITSDGRAAIESDDIGAHVTKKKSKMFNYDLLEEVSFWRDFLSGGTPRIICTFGKQQQIIVSTTLASTEVEWPGIPEEFLKPFKNVEYEDDLFSAAEYAQIDNESDIEEGADELG
jgi:hypothetical protein